jgi:uncharacterized protein
MRKLTGQKAERPFFNASDAISWALCLRRAWFDHNPPDGYVEVVDPFDELVLKKGLEHEARVLATMGPYKTAKSVEHTRELMEHGIPLIYQGLLVDATLGVVCQPDFLRLDNGEYRAEDAKFATRMQGKKDQIAQLGTYDIVLGSNRRTRALLVDDESYELTDKDLRTAETFLADMDALMTMDERPAANFVATKCRDCPYSATCVPQFEAEQNLGLDYFVDNRALPALNKRGIHRLSDLAKARVADLDNVPYLKAPEKQERAILQAQSYLEKRIIRIGDIELPLGNAIHFDIETWPFGANGQGTVYLWGFLVPPYDKATNYEYVWADEGDDRAGFLSALDMIDDYRSRIRNAVLVHYSNFELTQVRRLAERYELLDHPVVDWVLNDPGSCFDIQKSVTQALILPVTGYGLKAICKNPALVNFQWDVEESGSQWSVVRYSDYSECGDEIERMSIKDELLSYNRDDVAATRAQEIWLRSFVDTITA